MAMMKKPSLMQRGIAEAIGVFLLVFIGAGAVGAAQYISPLAPPLIDVAIANGVALALAVTFAMEISGGHINPAVTIAAWVTRRIKTGEAVAYILYQITGAVIAATFLVFLMPQTAVVLSILGTPTLSANTTPLQGIIIEGVLTFLLVFAVFATVIDKRAPKIAGFGVGLTAMICVLMGGPFTGAAMNPARYLGPAIVAHFLYYWYIYLIGPVVGGIVAALLYDYIFLKNQK